VNLKIHKRITIIILIALLAGVPYLTSASEFQCAQGEKVTANLGEGVKMHTCVREKEPGVFIRSGTLELIKNGILILKTQTDKAGQLHGQYTSWNDQGDVVENGNYIEGRKEGAWLFVGRNGDTETLFYNRGILVGL